MLVPPLFVVNSVPLYPSSLWGKFLSRLVIPNECLKKFEIIQPLYC